jgi:SAM-dependent methyltransferase
MGLRAFLIITSFIIIMFCVSLVFEDDQDTRSFFIEGYQDLDYHESRSHSLEDLNQKIAPLKIEDVITEALDKNRQAGNKTRVMELGTGNGRVLMALKKKFPDVEFYGINKEKTHTFYRRESYIHSALRFGIFSKKEIESLELPYAVFMDLDYGNSIPYGDQKFDLIFSQSTLHYIKYKFELFNEILRLLKPGGVSIHTHFKGVRVHLNNITLDPVDTIDELRKRGMDIRGLETKSSILFKRGTNLKNFPLKSRVPIQDAKQKSLQSDFFDPENDYDIEN